MQDIVNESNLSTRRRVLGLAAAAGLGAAALAIFGVPTIAFANDEDPEDVMPGDKNAADAFPGIPGRNINEVVLNFALTLENLEADLYRQALNLASGRPLTSPLSGNPSVYKRKASGGGLSADDTAAAFLYLRQFTYVEAAHRDFLKAAIKAGGGKPVVPNRMGYHFTSDVAPNMKAILTAILPLEETGVRAYLGALPFITKRSIAVTAGSIFSTEARHSAVVSRVLGGSAGPRKMAGDQMVAESYPSPNTFEYFLQPSVVIDRVGAFYGE